MSRLLLSLLLFLPVITLPLCARTPDDSLLIPPPAKTQALVSPRYGLVSRTALRDAMPETRMARAQMDSLRSKFAHEAEYNERSFRRQFSEYLQVQKNLPEAILRKRQGDLQISMERALAFRRQGEELLRQAEADLFASINHRLDAAIRVVGAERGYEAIIDTDLHAFPYLQPSLTEDANAFVREHLTKK